MEPYNYAAPDMDAILYNTWAALDTRDPIPSRNGPCKELLGVTLTLEEPKYVLVTMKERRDFYFQKLYESLWILTGKNEIVDLTKFIKRAPEWSDDGKTWRGAYGPRLRRFGSNHIDQVQRVIDLLAKDPDSRQALIVIYDPDLDSIRDLKTKDLPCNNLLQFFIRDGMLHWTVYQRSCDFLWGYLGTNSFEWVTLAYFIRNGLARQNVAVELGSYIHMFGSLHAYEPMWERFKAMEEEYSETQGVVVPNAIAFSKLATMPMWLFRNASYTLPQIMKDLVGIADRFNKQGEVDAMFIEELEHRYEPIVAEVFVKGYKLWIELGRQPYTFELAQKLAEA